MATHNTKWIVFIGSFVIFLSGASTDMYAPALPQLAAFFGSTKMAVQATITSFIVGFGAFQLLYGIALDRFGRKKMLSPCLLLYVCICVVTVFSPSVTALILLRFCQGAMVAGISPSVKAFFSDSFTGKQLDKAISTMIIAWGSGPVISPFIGSYLTHFWSWKAVFIALAIYAFIGWLLVTFCLPETLQTKSKRSVAYYFSAYKETLTHSRFLASMGPILASYLVLIWFAMVGPFFIQHELGYSVIDFGHIALFMGLAWFLGSAANRVILRYFSLIKIAHFGSALNIGLSIILVISTYIHMQLWNFLIPALMIMFTSAFYAACGNVLALKVFPEKAGIASSVQGAITVLAGALLFIPAALFGHYHTGTLLSAGFLVIALLCGALFWWKYH